MSIATRTYLLQQSLPSTGEWPDTFSPEAELAKVRELGPQLSALTGHTLRLDDKVRDAAFFAEWAAFDPIPRPWPGLTAEVRLCLVAIRFSAYNRMYTVWGNSPEHPVSEDTVAAVTQYLEPLGYVHVPQSRLHEPLPAEGPDSTWCSRFFAYQDKPYLRPFLGAPKQEQ